MEDTLIVVTNSDFIINDNTYPHYYFENGNLWYNISSVLFSVLKNYKTCIFQKSSVQINLLFTKLINEHNYTEINATENSIIFESNNILKKIILKKNSNDEQKIFLLSDEFINDHSVFGKFFGETNEYNIELNEKTYYDLVSYLYNIKLGISAADSIEFVGADPLKYHNYITNFEKMFYTKEFELLENTKTELRQYLVYGIYKFLEYATNIQKILLCIYTTNDIVYSFFKERNFLICSEKNYDINFSENNLSIKYENGEFQNINFEEKISYVFITKNPEIILVASEKKVFILAYQNKDFVNIFNHNENITEPDLKAMISYRLYAPNNYIFLITLSKSVVILKTNIWKAYDVYSRKEDSRIYDYFPYDLRSLYEKEEDIYIAKYLKYFVHKLEKI